MDIYICLLNGGTFRGPSKLYTIKTTLRQRFVFDGIISVVAYEAPACIRTEAH